MGDDVMQLMVVSAGGTAGAASAVMVPPRTRASLISSLVMPPIHKAMAFGKIASATVKVEGDGWRGARSADEWCGSLTDTCPTDSR